MVASLIRQESEFDSRVISHANAYGLMQLLPSVGKQLAREEGISHFETFQLLDPAMNIRLGTRYLRQMLDSLAACRSMHWRLQRGGFARRRLAIRRPLQRLDEFVESIPFTETREYVGPFCAMRRPTGNRRLRATQAKSRDGDVRVEGPRAACGTKKGAAAYLCWGV